jgi:hypothetical protein
LNVAIGGLYAIGSELILYPTTYNPPVAAFNVAFVGWILLAIIAINTTNAQSMYVVVKLNGKSNLFWRKEST